MLEANSVDLILVSVILILWDFCEIHPMFHGFKLGNL